MIRYLAALVGAGALLWAPLAIAASPPAVQFPGGFAPGEAIEGWDVTTGAVCVVGSTSTCSTSAGAPSSWATITVGVAFTPGQGIAAICSAAGTMTLAGSSATSITVPVGAGYNSYPLAATQITSTAACNFYVLR